MLADLNRDLDHILLGKVATSTKITKNIAALSTNQKLEVINNTCKFQNTSHLQIIAKDSPELLEFCQDFEEKVQYLPFFSLYSRISFSERGSQINRWNSSPAR